MQLISMKVECMRPVETEDSLLNFIGQVAGECYNSSMDMDKCIKRALNCIKRGHHSPWEHASITLKCTVDRGTSHALVRHRHCAFQQSSTIYQKFDDVIIIEQPNVTDAEKQYYEECEKQYKALLAAGMPPHRARDVLPNALATNLIITTNFRQWMSMIQRRCGPGDSDNMHKWCQMTREWFEINYPTVIKGFDDWYSTHPL